MSKPKTFFDEVANLEGCGEGMSSKIFRKRMLTRILFNLERRKKHERQCLRDTSRRDSLYDSDGSINVVRSQQNAPPEVNKQLT